MFSEVWFCIVVCDKGHLSLEHKRITEIALVFETRSNYVVPGWPHTCTPLTSAS